MEPEWRFSSVTRYWYARDDTKKVSAAVPVSQDAVLRPHENRGSCLSGFFDQKARIEHVDWIGRGLKCFKTDRLLVCGYRAGPRALVREQGDSYKQ